MAQAASASAATQAAGSDGSSGSTLAQGAVVVYNHVLRLSFLVVNSLFINIFQLVVVAAHRLGLLDGAAYKEHVKWSLSAFTSVLMTFHGLFCPTSFVLSGAHKQMDDASVLIIANHQTYADWSVMWSLVDKMGAGDKIRFFLKAKVKHIPIFGWGMQVFDFIFLQRSAKYDIDIIKKRMETLSREKDPMWLILFPEGTLNSPDEIEGMQKFAAKNNLKVPRHLLIPRVTGMYLILKPLQQQKTIEYIQDWTVGFEDLRPDQVPEDVFSLNRLYLDGQVPPPRIHVHIRKYRLADIPLESEAAFGKWLYDLYYEKDDMLNTFFRTGSFVPEESRADVEIYPWLIKPADVMRIFHVWVINAGIFLFVYIIWKLLWRALY